MKKQYQAPTIKSETFVPQEYVAACFTYRADLVCALGQYHKEHDCDNERNPACYEGTRKQGAHHGEPCAESTVSVTVRNGAYTISGTEGANKTHITLASINIPGVDQVSYVGQAFDNCTWTSTDGGTYNHHGSGKVTYFSRQANAS